MHHGVAHLDPGGPAVDQDASGPAFEDRQQTAGRLGIAIVHLQGGGQLAFKAFGQRLDLMQVGTLKHQGSRTEHLGLQRFVAEKVTGRGHEQARLTLIETFALLPSCHFSDLVAAAQALDALGVGVMDARGQHGLGARGLDGVGGRLDEGVQGLAPDRDHQPRVGAELSGAHGQRADKGLAQILAAGLERLGQQEHRVDGAHLRVEGDGFRSALGALPQGHAATARASEAGCLDAAVLDQRLAHLASGAEDQRKHAVGQRAAGHRLLYCAADELGRAGVGRVGLDHHRAASGQGRSGVAAGHREG